MRPCDTVQYANTTKERMPIEIPPVWWLELEGNSMAEWGRVGQIHRKFICWLDEFDVNQQTSTK